MSQSSTTSSELELLKRENEALKFKLDTVQKENLHLKESLYDLSCRFDLVVSSSGSGGGTEELEEKSKGSPRSVITNKGSSSSGGGGGAEELEEKSKTDTSVRSSQRVLAYRATLCGHKGAVFNIKFSPTRNLLSSCSFDNTLRVFDIGSSVQKELCTFTGHDGAVVDLCYSLDGESIASCSYDGTSRIWDLNRDDVQVQVFNHNRALCLSVLYHPTNQNVVHTSCTNKQVRSFDSRMPNLPALVIENDAMVNTMHVYRNGKCLITGDQAGLVKRFDLRYLSTSTSTHSTHLVNKPINIIGNGSSNKPISYLHASPRRNDIGSASTSQQSNTNKEGQYLAVNAYDNLVRIYDRTQSALTTTPEQSDGLTLVRSLSAPGFSTCGYPIKSSFYLGEKRQLRYSALGLSDFATTDHSLQESFLLATGSVDGAVYIFDLDQSSLVSRLEGHHKDKVYAAEFHPKEPVLATCSGDSTIILWAMTNREK